jgi:hypothetical protein
MKLEVKRLKKDDPSFGFKKGDYVLVDTDYSWDKQKCICVAKLSVRNDHSFYLNQLDSVTVSKLDGAEEESSSINEYEFARRYASAIASFAGNHGISTWTIEALQACGLTSVESMVKAGVDAFDIKILTPAIKCLTRNEGESK